MFDGARVGAVWLVVVVARVVVRSGGFGIWGAASLSTLPAIWSVARDGVNATWLERAMCVVISPYAIDTLY